MQADIVIYNAAIAACVTLVQNLTINLKFFSGGLRKMQRGGILCAPQKVHLTYLREVLKAPSPNGVSQNWGYPFVEYRGRVGCRVSQEWGYFLGPPQEGCFDFFGLYWVPRIYGKYQVTPSTFSPKP